MNQEYLSRQSSAIANHTWMLGNYAEASRIMLHEKELIAGRIDTNHNRRLLRGIESVLAMLNRENYVPIKTKIQGGK